MEHQVIIGIDEAIKAVMEYQNWKYDKAREMVNHYYTKRGYTLIG